MKTIFFTGKGGVGKSTLSSAVSWQLASLNYRVLTVSFDPAHNLGDIFGVKLSHRKKRFDKELYLMEVDLERSLDRYVKENISLVQEIYSYLKPFNMDRYFSIFKYTPGIEEYAALTALEKITREEKGFDYIVFDTPPTGLTVRILALPQLTLAWIERLLKIRRQILDKRHTIYNIEGKQLSEGMVLPYKTSDDPVMQKLNELEKRYTQLRDFMQGSSNTMVVVFNPDYLSARESQRLMNSLEELGLPFRVAFHNKASESNGARGASVEKQLL